MPRPIEPLLDDVFYTHYRAPKQAAEVDPVWSDDGDSQRCGNCGGRVNTGSNGPVHDKNNSSTCPENKSSRVAGKCDCGARGDELHDSDCASYSGTNCSECGAQSNELHDADCPKAGRQSSYQANLDNFGDKKAKPFGSEDDDDDIDDQVSEFLNGGKERGGGQGGYNDPSEKKKSRVAGESTSDDFYGGGKDNDYYADLNDGPEGEDKHPDPFVQRMREKNAAGTREEMELGLRGDCQMCLGTGDDMGQRCVMCNGTGNKSGQPDNQSPGTSWVPPNYQSARQANGQTCAVCGQALTPTPNPTTGEVQLTSPDGWGTICGDAPNGEHVPNRTSGRKKLAKDSDSSSGPSFTAPDSMRGGWKCSDCSADDLGVHDLNGHAEAHRQTSHRESSIGLFL
jgi:hypothetical protein